MSERLDYEYRNLYKSLKLRSNCQKFNSRVDMCLHGSFEPRDIFICFLIHFW